jgi:hypothetical protein
LFYCRISYEKISELLSDEASKTGFFKAPNIDIDNSLITLIRNNAKVIVTLGNKDTWVLTVNGENKLIYNTIA